MSTHKSFDLVCVAVLILTLAITVLFLNGSSLGIETIIDEDAEQNSGSVYFTGNDRKGDWNTDDATRITLTGDGATISGGGAYAYQGDVVIASAGRYVLSGTLTDGSVIVDTDRTAKVWILLDGVDIRCSDDACLRVDQADKVFLTLAAGSENSMASGAESAAYPFSSDMASAWVRASLFITPRRAEVFVFAPAALAPRMVMHRCSASITTATPWGSSRSIRKSAIWEVSRSWIWGRRAKQSTIRASLERPITFPSLGM